MDEFHGVALRSQQTLEDGRVLRVHRVDGGLAAPGLRHHQGSGRHEGLLVGQGDLLAGVDGCQRGLEPAEAYHRRYDYVYLRGLHLLAGSVDAAAHFHFRGKGGPHEGVFLRIADGHLRDLEGQGLFHQFFRRVVGRYHPDPETVRVLPDHVQRLGADRPRGAQDGDFFHIRG